MVKTNESNSSRRSFLGNSIALSVGIGVNGLEPTTDAIISTPMDDKIRKLMGLFNLKYPIFQAPTSGPAGETLAVAIANAGAMAALPLTWDSPEDAYQHVTKVKAATKGSFYVNYVLNFEPKSLDKALEAGATIVQFSGGIPSKEIVSKLRSAGAKMGIQITSSRSAKVALEAGLLPTLRQCFFVIGNVKRQTANSQMTYKCQRQYLK